MTKTTKYSFICKICNHKFECHKHLESHLERKAYKIHKYYCKYCCKGFTTDNSMYRHIKHT